MTDKLQSCPFCGSEAVITDFDGNFNIGCEYSDCGIHPETHIRPVKQEVIIKWNTRAPSKDRKLLIKLSQPKVTDENFDACYNRCKHEIKSSKLKMPRITTIAIAAEFLGMANIALKIRKHLEEKE